MSRLADHVADEAPPTDQRLSVDASPDGGEFTGLVTTAPVAPGDYEGAFAKVYALAGLDPAKYRIVGDTVRFSAWEQSARAANGDRDKVTLYAYRAKFERIGPSDAAVEDVAGLLSIAKANAGKRPPANPNRRTRVVVVSDPQIGKVGSRGGTPALLERLAGLLVELDAIITEDPCEDVVIVDPGDLCEGFENVAAQAFTNDLSHPAQLRVARAVLTDIITSVAARHTAATVVTVPSNHTAWRRGKDVLGKPTDDYGIDTHAAVSEALARDPQFRHVTWVTPAEWDESVALPVRGAVIGVTHGHQVNRPDGVPAWWKGQSHGGQAITKATLLITGHYHHLRVQPSGALEGRARWWFQAPTLDNGSDWFRNTSGEDTEPGILTFTLDDEGRWDGLRLITVR